MAEVVVRSLSNLQQQIIAPPHTYVADEPLADGGDDLGGTPYEFLLGALGSCTNMTLFAYARHKGWDLRRVETHLSHDHDYAHDCTGCEREGAFLDVIHRRVVLEGDLDTEQVARLREIARRCPVHKTLSRSVEIHDGD